MDWRLLLILGIACQWRWSSGATLKQLVEGREELKQVKDLIEDLSPYSLVLNSNIAAVRYTVFLPENSAFNKTYFPSKLLTFFKGTSRSTITTLDDILSYNTIQDVAGKSYTTSVMTTDVSLETQKSQTYLFHHRIPGVGDFINGARIIEADIQATNGVLHILDKFLWDVGREGRALKYLQDSDEREEGVFDAYFVDVKINKFRELLLEYERLEEASLNPVHIVYLLGSREKLTLFLPHDDALTKLGSTAFQALKGDRQQLKQVVESHLVRGQVLHTGVLDHMMNQKIGAVEESITPRKFKDQYYVSNNCSQGKIIRANITVGNGVIHIIDGLLGYVHTDIFTTVKNDYELTRFYTHMFSTPELQDSLKMKDLSQEADVDSLYTVFAPVDAAWESKDFTQDVDKLIQTMQMHVVKGIVNIADMRDGVSRNTMRSQYPATFKQIGDDIYVGVDYIWGKIIEADICVKNGIIHKVDNVLGTAVDLMWNYVSDRDDLAETYQVMRNLGLDAVLKDAAKRITFFAPTNEAFATMRQTQRGQTLLDPRERDILRNVMYRHISNEMVTLRTISDSYDVDPIFGRFTVERDGNGYTIPFGQFRIHVIDQDLKMTNGIMHVIDHVIYSEDPAVDERTGDATLWRVSLTVMSVTVCLSTLSLVV